MRDESDGGSGGLLKLAADHKKVYVIPKWNIALNQALVMLLEYVPDIL